MQNESIYGSDTVFGLLFNDRQRLLELYNAIRLTSYSDCGELIVHPMRDVIYLGMPGDSGIFLGFEMYLFEHRCFPNSLLPLKILFSITGVFSSAFRAGSEATAFSCAGLPPAFVVLYNGLPEMPEKSEVRMSDKALQRGGGSVRTVCETNVTVINVNKGRNRSLTERCRMIGEYSEFVGVVRSCIREREAGCNLQVILEEAVRFCISHNILADFLRKNKKSVIELSLRELASREEKYLFWSAGFGTREADIRAEVYRKCISLGVGEETAREIAGLK